MLPDDARTSAPSALRHLVERGGRFLGTVAAQELRRPAVSREIRVRACALLGLRSGPREPGHHLEIWAALWASSRQRHLKQKKRGSRKLHVLRSFCLFVCLVWFGFGFGFFSEWQSRGLETEGRGEHPPSTKASQASQGTTHPPCQSDFPQLKNTAP